MGTEMTARCEQTHLSVCPSAPAGTVGSDAPWRETEVCVAEVTAELHREGCVGIPQGDAKEAEPLRQRAWDTGGQRWEGHDPGAEMVGTEPACQHHPLTELPSPEPWGLPHFTPRPLTCLAPLLFPRLRVWPWMCKPGGELSEIKGLGGPSPTAGLKTLRRRPAPHRPAILALSQTQAGGLQLGSQRPAG